MKTSTRITHSTFNAWFVDEVPLYFADNSKDVDPKHGLTIYGPFDWSNNKPDNFSIKVGVVSTGEGIHAVKQFLRDLENEVENKDKQPFLRPHFPGMPTAFKCSFKFDEKWDQIISSGEVNEITSITAFDLKVKRAAEIYSRKVANICDKTSRPDVIICHENDILEKTIGAGTLSSDKQKGRLSAVDKRYYAEIKRKSSQHQILFPLDDDINNMLDVLIPNDFRRLLKATCVSYVIPTQIVANSTIECIKNYRKDLEKNETSDEDPAEIAWNLAIALYYKSGHSPWKVASLRPGTCYVGISFYRDQTGSEKNMRASLAQIFTDTGEGLIWRGKGFKWDDSKGKIPHLSKEGAYNLLKDAVELYTNHKGQKPERVVVHKSSIYTQEEIEGFRDAIKGISFHDFISLAKSRGLYLYRNGEHAVLRGTIIELDDNDFLIFTKGFVPYLRSYPGLRVPRALQITERYGDSTPEEIIREILALTRLNWNTTSFSCSWPMTLQFSRAVGEILARVPDNAKIQTQYRFYM